MPALPYRPNVCLIILNAQNAVLIGERKDFPGTWQLPQGGLDNDSHLENDLHVHQNAIREASEELGAPEDAFAVLTVLQARNEYDFLNPPDYAKGVFRGQSQRYVVLRFLGKTEMLKPLSVAEPEFSTFRWVAPAAVLNETEPKRRPAYARAMEELEEWLQLSSSSRFS